MSVRGNREGRYVLALALAVLGIGVTIGAAVGASRLGLVVPAASSGSFGDATAILLNNMEIWALFVGVTLLQPRGVPSLSRGFLPLWMTDLTVAAVLVLNLVAVGGVLGALGLHALIRIVPHAPLEVGGYLALVVAYLRARRGALERGGAARAFAIAAALLACGAFVESYVSGGLG